MLQINKAARALPHGGTHPEIYSPTLEIVSLTKLIELVREEKIDLKDFEEILKKKEKGAERVANKWVRQKIVAPAIKKCINVFSETPFVDLEKDEKKGKIYFRQAVWPLKCLVTSTSANDIEVFQRSLKFKNDGQKEVFLRLYGAFQSEMFTPQVNEALIPSADEPGRFVLATFGEDRFQLIKVRNFLARLRELGLRLPDEIVYFQEGRKAPVLKHIFEQNSERVEDYQQIHIDNSPRQIRKIIELGITGMEAILFDPKEDRGKSFSELITP